MLVSVAYVLNMSWKYMYQECKILYIFVESVSLIRITTYAVYIHVCKISNQLYEYLV